MKTYIWSLPTRIFHWLLVFFIFIAYLSSEKESLLYIHIAFGYGVGVLVIFRIIWGFIGPKWSRFRDFPLTLKEALEFLKNIFMPKKRYLGHNPLASFVMVGMLIVLVSVVLTGLLTYGVQEGRGVFASLNLTLFRDMELFEELHEVAVSLLLTLIVLHLTGLFTDYLLHKDDKTLQSIFTGYKSIDGESIKLTGFQKVIATVLLLIATVTPIYIIFYQSPLNRSIYKEIDYQRESNLFFEECGSCHIIYPPHLLPKNSWLRLMEAKSLKNHFGDDASLDESDRVEIESFLTKNSANNSTKEASFYILKSLTNRDINGKADIISITKTAYWHKRHRDIDRKIFESKEVKSKSNCKACHSRFEKGLIEDRDIKL